jgi:hypothetical protein
MTREKDYFASPGCPVCDHAEGPVHIGKGHWYYCREHKLQWTVGSNLMSSWRDQTVEERRRIYDELGLADFTIVGYDGRPRDLSPLTDDERRHVDDSRRAWADRS